MADEKTESAQEQRKRISRTHRWDADVLEAVNDYMADQEVAPTEIAVLEKAAREFLSKRGYLPRKAKRTHKAERRPEAD